MAKPFIALDGEDRQGVRAEVWVQTGSAQITEIKPPRSWTAGGKDWDPTTSSEKPSNVNVKVTNEHIRDGIAGWLSTSDPLYAEVVKAYSLGTEVEYRVEWQRNKDVDRTKTAKELRGFSEETQRSDMGLSGKNGKNIFAGIDGMLAKEAVTDPEQDPDRGGRVSAIGQARKAKAEAPTTGGPGLSLEGTLTALATARAAGMPEGVTGAAAALALAAGATAKQVAEAGVSEQSPAQRREVARAHAKEATPYTAYNTDGRLNLGSSAVQAAFGAERVANGLLVADRLAAFEKHNAAVAAGEVEADLMDSPDAVSFGQTVAMAGVLLDLADRVQVGAYGGGRPDRMSNSHVRSRSLVYQAIESTHPIPFGADTETRTAWMEALVAECVGQFAALASIAFPSERQAAPVQREQAPAAQAPAPQQQATPQQSPEAQAPVQEQAAPPVAEAPVEAAPAQQEAPVEKAPVEMAPIQQAPAQQVGQQARPPKPPVEGEDGYVKANPDIVVRFGTLTADAGFTPGPDSPVVAYLTKKFGVTLARQVHGPALQALVEWFERQNDPTLTFRGFVLREAGQDEQAQDQAASA